MTKEEYLAAVAQTKEHIQAGDVFQLVLSQRFQRHTQADPFEIYRSGKQPECPSAVVNKHNCMPAHFATSSRNSLPSQQRYQNMSASVVCVISVAS